MALQTLVSPQFFPDEWCTPHFEMSSDATDMNIVGFIRVICTIGLFVDSVFWCLGIYVDVDRLNAVYH